MRSVVGVLVSVALMLSLGPTSAGILPGLENDAGSGRDAPDTPSGDLSIRPGVVYEGNHTGFPVDEADWYAFGAEAGETLHAVLRDHSSFCNMRLVTPDGQEASVSCRRSLDGRDFMEYVIDRTGTWHLGFGGRGAGIGTHGHVGYRFSIGLDAPAMDPRTPEEAERWNRLEDLALGRDPGGGLPDVSPATERDEHVVIAVIDSGINPYHAFFRAPDLQNHPSTWLSGFPTDATAVNLTLDVPSYSEAVAADQPEWDGLQRSWYNSYSDTYEIHTYTFPGTRVVGAVSFSDYGSDSGSSVPVLDENGHGTASAGLAAGANLPEADGNVLIYLVEVSGADVWAATRWAARQPFVDAVSVSWGTLANLPLSETFREFIGDAEAAGRPLFVSSGNGWTGAALGPEHCQTHASPMLGPNWVTRIGAAHPETGNPTWWHCVPVDAIARTNVPSPSHRTLAGATDAGGTSASTPNAASHFAHLLLDARRAGVDAPRPLVLEHLLNSSRPAEPKVRYGSEPSLGPASSLDQGYGLIDDRALDRARARLLGGEGPEPRPELDAWWAADRAVRDALWGDDTWALREEAARAVQALLPAFSNDAGSSRDAPSGPSDATPVEPGRVYQGNRTGMLTDSSDWYALPVGSGDAIEVRVFEPGTVCPMRVMDSAGKPAPASCSMNPLTGTSVATSKLEGGGPWYLETRSAHPAHYRFSFQVAGAAPEPSPARQPDPGGAPAQDDAGSGRDAGADPSGAVPVEPGVTYRGLRTGALTDPTDWFAFEAPAGARLTAGAFHPPFGFTVRDANGDYVAGSRTSLVTWQSTLETTLPETGKYHLVFDGMAPVAYEFSFHLE